VQRYGVFDREVVSGLRIFAVMRLVVNARTVVPGKLDGMGWYTYEIGRRLLEALPSAEHHWLFDRTVSPSLVPEGVIPHVVRPPARHPFLWHIWHQYRVPVVLRRLRASVYWSPDGFIPLSTSVPTVATLHDIAFEHNREHTTRLAGMYYRWMFPKCAAAATRLTTVSEAVRRDITSVYGIPEASIDIVPNGVRGIFSPTDDVRAKEARHVLNNGRSYILNVGTVQPRKNHVRLIQAFDRFLSTTGADVDLICVGGLGWSFDEVHQAHASAIHRDRIRFIGYVHDEQLAQWYEGASMFVFVPLLEGFGVPIIEAFTAGVPVVTSNRPPMTDVGANAAHYADPESVESIVSAITHVWNDELLQDNYVQKGFSRAKAFSWEAAAGALKEVIEGLTNPPRT